MNDLKLVGLKSHDCHVLMQQLLKKFNISDANKMKTPMHPTTYLGLDEESTKVDRTQYRAMIGSLLYLTAFRPYIMFNLCLCARFEKETRELITLVLCSKEKKVSDSQAIAMRTMLMS